MKVSGLDKPNEFKWDNPQIRVKKFKRCTDIQKGGVRYVKKSYGISEKGNEQGLPRTGDIQAFAHRDRLCSLFKKKPHDPSAPYDAYDESDDTEENAKSGYLKGGTMKWLIIPMFWLLYWGMCFLGTGTAERVDRDIDMKEGVTS